MHLICIDGFLPQAIELAIESFTSKGKRKEEFGVRLGKLSGRKDYRKVIGGRLGIVPFFTRIIV